MTRSSVISTSAMAIYYVPPLDGCTDRDNNANADAHGFQVENCWFLVRTDSCEATWWHAYVHFDAFTLYRKMVHSWFSMPDWSLVYFCFFLSIFIMMYSIFLVVTQLNDTINLQRKYFFMDLLNVKKKQTFRFLDAKTTVENVNKRIHPSIIRKVYFFVFNK